MNDDVPLLFIYRERNDNDREIIEEKIYREIWKQHAILSYLLLIGTKLNFGKNLTKKYNDMVLEKHLNIILILLHIYGN